MTRSRASYVCQDCGAIQARWAGQCPDCQAWNTLVETVVSSPAARGKSREGDTPIARLESISAESVARLPSGLAEVDRVLGGGLVRGMVMLLGGDPGVGKSTLLLQVLAAVEGRWPTLYVTGEESLSQVALRARRLGLSRLDLPALAETRLEAVLDAMRRSKAQLVVIDSIQTLYSDSLVSAPGSVSQVRECAAQLVRYAKTADCAVVLIGHMTKEGAIAGPRVVEHLVDTVLYFEHDGSSRFRIVRAAKNRFGAVNELGVFAMTDAGLKEVSNPSALFLSRHAEPVPGSVVTVTRQGTRPLLVEVQALVDTCAGNAPRRVALGLEGNRLAMLLAVLHRHAGISLSDQDVFTNVVGGLRIQEPASDLPVLLAALSSVRNRPFPAQCVAFGEIGLAGEIRPVQAGEERLQEAAKQGFNTAYVPEGNRPRRGLKLALEVRPLRRLSEALEW